MDACREYEGLISAFIDGEITEPERGEAHGAHGRLPRLPELF